MRLDWYIHHARELVDVLGHCSVSRSGSAGPVGQVLAVVLALMAVAEVGVERAAFVEQALALRP